MTADDGRTVVPSEFFDALLEDTPPVPNEATRQAQRRLPHIIASSDGHVEYAWGESVTWTHPGRITIPLNRDGEYAADLVLDAKETSVLIDMLADAANPKARQACDRRRTIWKDQDAYDREQVTDAEPEDARPAEPEDGAPRSFVDQHADPSLIRRRR